MLSQAAITTALSLTLLIAAIISICIFLSNNLVKLRGLSNGGLVSIVTLSSDGDGVQHLYIGSDGFTCTHANGAGGGKTAAPEKPAETGQQKQGLGGYDDVFGRVEGLEGTEVTLQDILQKEDEEKGTSRFEIPSFL